MYQEWDRRENEGEKFGLKTYGKETTVETYARRKS
jgi:hypothetical protein